MTLDLNEIQRGDVLVIDTGSYWGRWIKLGGWLRGRGGVDHIAIAHHVDDSSTFWAIEGRPGGCGWVDLGNSGYRIVTSNAGQPRTLPQRQMVCDLAESMLKTKYDWNAIAIDAAHDLHLPQLWKSTAWGPEAPAHVVCSSLAAWVHNRQHLAAPSGGRWVEPGDWRVFCDRRAWGVNR